MSFLLLQYAPIHTSAQTAIGLKHNSIRVGDVVKMYEVQTDDVWDLSSSEKQYTVYESYENFKTDSITALFNGTRKYYMQHSDSLLYLGVENPQLLDSCYIPEVSCVYPMHLNDRHDGVFACYTTYCDKIRYHKYGTYTVYADTIGTLLLPADNRLPNVMQVSHKRRYMYEQIELDTTVVLPGYSESEILQRLIGEGDVYTEVEKELYARGYRYPIVKDYILYNSKDEIMVRKTYYKPADDDAGINLDEANIHARQQNGNEDLNDTDKNNNWQSVMSSLVKQDTTAKSIIFDGGKYIESLPTDSIIQCKLLISDNKAVVFRSREFTLDSYSKGTVSVSYSGLRTGHYVVSLIINNQIFTENFIFE